MNASLPSPTRQKGVGKVFPAAEVETRKQPGINHTNRIFTAGSSSLGNTISQSISRLPGLSTEGRFSLYGEAVATPGLAERTRMRYREAGFFSNNVLGDRSCFDAFIPPVAISLRTMSSA